VFERLDFVYLPSRDVAADVAHYTSRLGGELVFAIERFGTRVAMVRLSAEEPDLLLAEHLEGDRPILIFRVTDLAAALAELEAGGVETGEPFEMPYGRGVELRGRRDF
jgi:non-ribosomal peptide synthetase component F